MKTVWFLTVFLPTYCPTTTSKMLHDQGAASADDMMDKTAELSEWQKDETKCGQVSGSRVMDDLQVLEDRGFSPLTGKEELDSKNDSTPLPLDLTWVAIILSCFALLDQTIGPLNFLS